MKAPSCFLNIENVRVMWPDITLALLNSRCWASLPLTQCSVSSRLYALMYAPRGQWHSSGKQQSDVAAQTLTSRQRGVISVRCRWRVKSVTQVSNRVSGCQSAAHSSPQRATAKTSTNVSTIQKTARALFFPSSDLLTKFFGINANPQWLLYTRHVPYKTAVLKKGHTDVRPNIQCKSIH